MVTFQNKGKSSLVWRVKKKHFEEEKNIKNCQSLHQCSCYENFCQSEKRYCLH
jgi:uncharacterized protein (DUF2249 family)